MPMGNNTTENMNPNEKSRTLVRERPAGEQMEEEGEEKGRNRDRGGERVNR